MRQTQISYSYSYNAYAQDISAAVQQICLETLGDLFLRFTSEYKEFPYRLLRLLDEGLAETERRDIAKAFLDLPKCCLVFCFEGRIAKLFPSVDAILSEQCLELLEAWAENTSMITKQIEFGHRGVGSHARAKGPAKPAEFQHVADKYLVNRVAVLHNEALKRIIIKVLHNEALKRIIIKRFTQRGLNKKR